MEQIFEEPSLITIFVLLTHLCQKERYTFYCFLQANIKESLEMMSHVTSSHGNLTKMELG